MFEHDAPTAGSGSPGPVVDRGARVRSGLEERLERLLDEARALAAADLGSTSPSEVQRLLATQKRVDAAMAAWRASLVGVCDEDVLARAGAVDREGLLRACPPVGADRCRAVRALPAASVCAAV